MTIIERIRKEADYQEVQDRMWSAWDLRHIADDLATDYAKLEAENAELLGERNSAEQELYAANATLDRLREVFLRICKGNEMSEAIDDMDAILYPTPENDND